MKTIEEIIQKLTTNRWIELRSQYNRAFMAYGPGESWDQWKRDSQNMAQEEALLAQYLGKEPLISWLVSGD